MVINIVLSTDMSHHFQQMNIMKHIIQCLQLADRLVVLEREVALTLNREQEQLREHGEWLSLLIFFLAKKKVDPFLSGDQNNLNLTGHIWIKSCLFWYM